MRRQVRRDFMGLNKVYTFNPWNESWTEQPDMRHGRWYPTAARMADGRIVVINGLRRKRRGLSAQPRRGAVYAGGRSERARGRQPGGHAAHDWRRPSGWPLSAPVRDAVRAHDGGGAVPRGQLVPQPARTLDSYTSQDYPNMPTERLWATAVLMPGGTGGSSQVMQLGGSTSTPPRRWPQPRSSTRQTPRRAGRQDRRCRSHAATTTPCSCPTARWSQSAAASE